MIGWVPCMGQRRPPRGAARLRTDGHWSVRDLRGLWLLNEGVGNRAYDWTRNANHGVMPTGTWHWGDDPPYGMCFWREYSSTNQGLDCGDKPAYNTVPFSAVVLARMSGSQAYNQYFQRGYVTALADSVWWITKHSPSYLKFCGASETQTLWDLTVSHPTVGIWHMFVGTWDGTTGTNGVKLYSDGVLVKTGTAVATDIKLRLPIFIGGAQNTRNHQGPIALAAFYARPLTAQEIASLRHHPFQMLEVPTPRSEVDIISVPLTSTHSMALFGADTYTTDIETTLWASDKQYNNKEVVLFAVGELLDLTAAIALLASQRVDDSTSISLSAADVKAIARDVAMWGSDEEALNRALYTYGSSAETVARNIALYASDPEALAHALLMFGQESAPVLRGLAMYGLDIEVVDQTISLLGMDSETRASVLNVYGAEPKSMSSSVKLWGAGSEDVVRAVALLGAELAFYEWELSLYGSDQEAIMHALILAGCDPEMADRILSVYGAGTGSLTQAIMLWGVENPIRLVLPDAVWWITHGGTIYAERWNQ